MANAKKQTIKATKKSVSAPKILTHSERWEICKACPRFFAPTGQCKECGCFMRIKTRLPDATCPIGKWGKI
jgi:rRNA maturation endonuclease Nob1